MSLNNYLDDYLGTIADYLGWTTSGSSYDAIISDTLEAYGVASEALAADTKKLHVIARYLAWKSVCVNTVGDYDYEADGGIFSRSQVYSMAEKMMFDCYAEASVYLDANQIEEGEFNTEQDPYQFKPYYLRGL